MVFIIAVSLFARNAPHFIRSGVEKALHKKVKIGAIDYRFPLTFELNDFQIVETDAPFAGETLFAVDQVLLRLSPLALSQRALVVDELTVQNADIFIRKRQGKLSHIFSTVVEKNDAEVSGQGVDGTSPSKKSFPLEIHIFNLNDSRFRFMDYDVQDDGFVMGLDGISGVVRNIAVPGRLKRTSYEVAAGIPQGRERSKGGLHIAGWTVFASLDTNANFTLHNLYLPYFKPYYRQVTPAAIAEGSLDAKALLHIQEKRLASDIQLQLTGLIFQDYESDDQLFGLRAEELLSFLKDSSGRLKFQISLRWNIADRSVKPREVIRRSIEQSLKSTVLGNVGQLLENTLRKIDEQGVGRSKEDIEGAVKKIKDFLKY